MVVADGVDAADLTIQLSKKLGHASLKMVEQVEEKQDNKIEAEETKPSTSSSPPTSPYPSSYYHGSGEYELWKVFYDPQPAAGPCAIT